VNRVNLIYNAAARLFSEKGYRGASLQDLAQEVGIKKASLYHYVASKEELLYQIFLSVGERIQNQFLKIRKDCFCPLERIERYVTCYLSFVVTDEAAFQIFLTEKRELTPQHRERVNAICDLLSTLMREAILQAKEQGFVSQDVKEDLATLFIFGACNWAVGWFSPHGRYSMEEVARYFTSLFLGGLKEGEHHRGGVANLEGQNR